jgi:hypothetical protein
VGRNRELRVSRAVLGAFSMVAGTQACGDDTAAEIRAARLAEGCSIASDCIDPLTCAFQHCHVECTSDKDCHATGGRCVRSPTGLGVCQLPSERDCAIDGDCVGDEVCAVDQQCRDLCSDRHPCIEGLVCAASGECAQPGEVDASGNLQGDAGTGATGARGGSGGKGGSSGHGGTTGSGQGGSGATDAEGGSGATTDHGGAAGDEGSGASGGKDGTGSGATGGSSNDEGGFGGETGTVSPASGGTSGGSAGGSSAGPGTGGTAGMSGGGQGGTGAVVPEMEPNDDRTAAMPVASVGAVNASFTTIDDSDYFEVVTPASDPAGGYYIFTITDIPNGKLTFEVLSELDYNPVFANTRSGAVGAAMFGYWASAPDQRFLIHTEPYSGQSFPYGYKLTLDYVPIPDAGEPDDTRQTARSLAAGVTAQGYIFSGFLGSKVSTTEYQDFYAVPLAAGSYTTHVTDVPSTSNVELLVYDSSGTGLVQTWNATAGADLTDTRDAPAPGTYYFQISYLNTVASSAATTSLPGQVPDAFTHPYTFQVTQ